MKTLNLVNKDKSGVIYQVYPFPDGQQQITITHLWNNNEAAGPVKIISRLNSFKDLEKIICAVASLRELYVSDIHLYVPYFLGSRSDRKFEAGSNNYLKTVICPIINAVGFSSVMVVDPHSDVLEACLNGFHKETNEDVVKWALSDIYDHDSNAGNSKMVLVSPDAGASKKIYKVAETFEFTGDIIVCSKDRDNAGKLTKTIVPIEEHHLLKDFVIIDDICDGGATFINIAKQIKDKRAKLNPVSTSKIYLIITHGIFSKGFSELEQYFDGIFCTNSYSDVINYKKVKQYNLF